MVSSTAELDALLRTDVRTPIPPTTLLTLLSTEPFILSHSLINARDIGSVPGSAIPASRIFRCGTLEYASQDPEALAWLGGSVRRIFDLRRRAERESAPDPEIPGVENVWLESDGEYKEPSLEEFAKGDGSEAWRKQYLNVARAYTPIFRAVLEHIRDRPKEPFLFHCTAGRDRTGVLAGILHHLAGTPSQDSVRDYMLSRLGTEPAREKLIHFALHSTGASDLNTPGFYNLVDLRPGYWKAFLEGLEEQFGGWEGYITEALGITEADVEIIKRNIREP